MCMGVPDAALLISTAYLPPIDYIAELSKHNIIYIDIYENYLKQTCRNRCLIAAANGILSLSIPVIKTNGNHTAVKDIKIDYSQSWQKTHWRSIESAYNSSPFFLYYMDIFDIFYQNKYTFLIDLNRDMLEKTLKCLTISCEIKFTETYQEQGLELNDYRNIFSPKKKSNIKSFPEYTQVFSEKQSFIPNLSIIDLLFNEGNYATEYVKKIANT